MSRSHRFNALSFAIAALAPTWAVWRMTDVSVATAAAPVEPAEANDTATAAVADAEADTAEAAQAVSDEAPATVSIDVPAQHQSLLERAAALLEKADQWVVDNIEAGISHFEGLFKSETAATNAAGDTEGGTTPSA